MRRRILPGLAHVVGRGDDDVSDDQYRTDRRLALFYCLMRLSKCKAHEILVGPVRPVIHHGRQSKNADTVRAVTLQSSRNGSELCD